MLLRNIKNIGFFSRFCLLGLLFFLNACADLKKAVIHSYPKNSPFVFKNQIQIHDAPTKKIKKALQLELSHYWDDSLKANYIRQFGFFSTLIQPIKFQPERLSRSVNYMQAYLAAEGYNHANLVPSFSIDSLKNEYRTTVKMDLYLHLKTLIDTVQFNLSDSALQQIAIASKGQSYIKKGGYFSNQMINNELDRLVELFRSKGYYYFTKEKIFAEVDTLDQDLMQLKLDPLQQLDQVVTAAQKEKENPKWKISIQLRKAHETAVKTYPIGAQIFYSDLILSDNPDSIIHQKRQNYIPYQSILHAFNKPKFKTKLFEEQSIIQVGELFNEKKFYQTLNNFSVLGSWQQIDARTTVHNDSIYLHYLLVPSLRKSVSFDLEGSKNATQLGGGNLLGLSTSLTYRDKNVQKKSIPSITSIRTGIELNLNNTKDNLTQTLLWNIGHTYSFPNILLPFTEHQHAKNYATRSNFALNGSSIDRLNYYQLKSFTSSWGYEWKQSNNATEKAIIYKPINIELYQLNKFSKLDSLLILNPFLRSSFNEGNVMSQSFTYLNANPSKKFPNRHNYLRIGIEEAGAITNLIPGLKKNIYTYIKAELEWRKSIQFENTELAMRFIGGWGNNYSNDAKLGGQLPFFKQFTAGGPYSMRAWGLRQLGLGSSTFYDTSRSSQNFDRFGDLQLEANLEFRFNLFQWGSYKMGSAIFMDMGNIWNTRDTKTDPNAGFKLDRLYKDLAIGIGSGLRFDFNYFIIRIDGALKMKDPTRNYNKGWMDLSNIKWTELKPNGNRINNYAWQFGIGLPF